MPALGEWQLQIVWDLSVSDALAEVSTPTKSNGANQNPNQVKVTAKTAVANQLMFLLT